MSVSLQILRAKVAFNKNAAQPAKHIRLSSDVKKALEVEFKDMLKFFSISESVRLEPQVFGLYIIDASGFAIIEVCQ